jgi:hypothetical protein
MQIAFISILSVRVGDYQIVTQRIGKILMRSQKKHYITTRQLCSLALLAATNSAIEATLGSILHFINFPLTGLMMIGVNTIIYIFAHRVCPKSGIITIVALATVLGNISLGGAFKPFALTAIVLEGAIVDLLISLFGFRRECYIAASSLICLFSMIYPVLIATLFTHTSATSFIMVTFTQSLQMSPDYFTIVLLYMLTITILHIAAGFIFATIGWQVMKTTEQIWTRKDLEYEDA